ncbi:MAG: hypothetical protein GC147_11360 [Porphyrobacter sp.]|nr:hypothetical protein [Porphyrobacter sp.]
MDDTLGNRPFIVAALYLASFFLPVLIVVAVPLALVFRRESSEEWEASHYRYQLRTFLLAFGQFALLTLLFIVVASVFGRTGPVPMPAKFVLVPLGLAALAQFGVRSVLSMVRAVERQPMPRPDTLLI